MLNMYTTFALILLDAESSSSLASSDELQTAFMSYWAEISSYWRGARPYLQRKLNMSLQDSSYSKANRFPDPSCQSWVVEIQSYLRVGT